MLSFWLLLLCLFVLLLVTVLMFSPLLSVYSAGQVETDLKTHTGKRTAKLLKLRNNKREHRKREKKTTKTQHDKKATTFATINLKLLQMPDIQSNGTLYI